MKHIADLPNVENLADLHAMLTSLTLIDWLGILGSLIISGANLAVSRAWLDAQKPAFNACLHRWTPIKIMSRLAGTTA